MKYQTAFTKLFIALIASIAIAQCCYNANMYEAPMSNGNPFTISR